MFLNALEAYLFSPTCTLCKTPIKTAHFWLCPACASQMIPLKNPCPNCAMPMHGHIKCQSFSTASMHANLQYHAPLSTLIHRFKYHPEPKLASTLATYMWHHPPPWLHRIDAVLPMPLSTKRLRTRSFNQSHLLLKALQKHLILPLLKAPITRLHREKTQAQTHLVDRTSGMDGLFHCKESLESQCILIIDDVMTTGASIESLTQALLNAGAESVYAWVLARTT